MTKDEELREEYKEKEKELRKKCGLKDGELINTNLGMLDILGIGRDVKTGKDMVALGVLATGKIIYETPDSVLEKMVKVKENKINPKIKARLIAEARYVLEGYHIDLDKYEIKVIRKSEPNEDGYCDYEVVLTSKINSHCQLKLSDMCVFEENVDSEEIDDFLEGYNLEIC